MCQRIVKYEVTYLVTLCSFPFIVGMEKHVEESGEERTYSSFQNLKHTYSNSVIPS